MAGHAKIIDFHDSALQNANLFTFVADEKPVVIRTILLYCFEAAHRRILAISTMLTFKIKVMQDRYGPSSSITFTDN
jgi:hypothetical protein